MAGAGTRSWQARWTWRAIFAGIAFVYLYFVPYYPSLNNPNENSRVYQIRAAVELHKLSVNEQIERYGYVNDLAVRDGKFYAGKAPGTTFIGIAIYGALRSWERWRGHTTVSPFRLLYALRFAGCLVPTLVFLLWFRRYIGRVVQEEPIANALTIVLAIGSMLLSYALIFVNHSLTAALAFGALMATDAAARKREFVGGARVPHASWLWLGLAGFLISATSALDYALAPVSLVLIVWVPIRFGWSWASTVGAWAGASIPALWTGIYHKICWGGPFKLSINHLANPQFATNQSKGVFGIVGPTRDSMYTLLVSPSKGLLYLSPVFAVALIATVYACIRSKRRKDAILSLVVVWMMIAYACSLTNWDAGWTVGPRYATVIVAFAVYSMALSWAAMGHAARRAWLPIAAAAGVLSAIAMTATSVLFPHLPPDYKNPVYEIIWPLWRDGITPYSFGLRWLKLTGHAAQAPFLVVFGLLIAYLVRVATGWGLGPRWRSWWAAPLSGVVAIALVAGGVRVAKIARTDTPNLVQLGTAWLRNAIWYPPIPKAPVRPGRQ